MSSDLAIEAIGLGKAYRIYAKPYHRLLQSLGMQLGAKSWRDFQALSGVDLQIFKGETVGIVGKNGSGKSTLLQILCGTLNPSHGSVRVNGRIAALLELGAGFNPDFSGRENVFLNAALLGMTRSEAEHRFSDIVRFADIGEHIDHPVSTYSSGMYIRLAFAVAISVQPEILIVDEALSVGDEAFQRKCFSRIEELKRSGCTILFVSHSASSIVQLCDRALLLDEGELLTSGAPKDVVALYQRLLYSSPESRRLVRSEILSGGLHAQDSAMDAVEGPQSESVHVPAAAAFGQVGSERFETALRAESTIEYESQGARILDPHLVNAEGHRVNVLAPGSSYVYRYRVKFDRTAERVHFGMMIKSLAGVDLFGMASHPEGASLERVSEGAEVEVEFSFESKFLPGVYFTNAGCIGEVGGSESKFLHRILDAFVFKIETRKTDRRKAGFYDLSIEPACRIRVGSQSLSATAGDR